MKKPTPAQQQILDETYAAGGIGLSQSHTPGQWIVRGNVAESLEVWALCQFGEQCVASLDGGPRMEADARLIAAAPHMYAFIAAIAKRQCSCHQEMTCLSCAARQMEKAVQS